MPEQLNRKARKKIEQLTVSDRDYTVGRVSFNHADCSKCGLCAAVCPGGAIRFNGDGMPEMKTGIEGLCMSCGDCLAACPGSAISLERYIQFNHYYRYLDRGEPQMPRRF